MATRFIWCILQKLGKVIDICFGPSLPNPMIGTINKSIQYIAIEFYVRVVIGEAKGINTKMQQKRVLASLHDAPVTQAGENAMHSARYCWNILDTFLINYSYLSIGKNCIEKIVERPGSLHEE